MVTYKEKSASRLPLAITLVVASFLSACVLAATSSKGSQYWIARHTLIPGSVISSQDISLAKFALGKSSLMYLSKNDTPIGQVVTQKISAQLVIPSNSVASDTGKLSLQLVPARIMSSDMPQGVSTGDLVDIYWVDNRDNGQAMLKPTLVVNGVFVVGIDRSGKNFGSDIGLTLSIPSDVVLNFLNATTSGRLVVVSSHG
jgi:hypothetical protein